MSDHLHTPGPWFVCTEPQNSQWLANRTVGTESPKGGRRVADAAFFDPDDVAFANARLIAAAPDLLACCELAQIAFKNRDQTPGEANILAAIQIAIAKAIGVDT